MEHSPIKPTRKAPAATFTGDVDETGFATPHDASRLVGGLVRFTPGAGANWHSPDVGQTLHGDVGRGFADTRDGRVVDMRPGESVMIAPREDHWHGARRDTLMAHDALLEVNEDGSDPTTGKEPVTDEQYPAAHESEA